MVAPAIPSKLEWTNGPSPDSTWTRALVTWLCDLRKQSCAGTGWDSPASESSRVLMIAREQQFAEKIHAYTLPRNAANSRVKDLVDLALLIGSGELDKRRILEALRLTFERRGTHDLRRAWFRRQQIGRSRFKPWRRNAGSRRMSPRCLRVFRSSSKKCWHNAQSGERGMTENGSDSLPFEPPEQENVRLREENARLRRLLAVHSIPIPQLLADAFVNLIWPTLML